jgi:hypothetical protein
MQTMYLSVVGLTAVEADDKVLRLYDVVAARLVRMFHGHTDRITDICFKRMASGYCRPP